MKKKFLALVTASALALSLAACGGSSSSAASSAPAASGATSGAAGSSSGTFKLGVIGPLTGENAIYGQAVANGAQIAVDEINAAGGVKGKPLELVVYDDKSSPEGAVKAVTRMVDVDKVVAMVGSNSSPNIIAGADIT